MYITTHKTMDHIIIVLHRPESPDTHITAIATCTITLHLHLSISFVIMILFR